MLPCSDKEKHHGVFEYLLISQSKYGIYMANTDLGLFGSISVNNDTALITSSTPYYEIYSRKKKHGHITVILMNKQLSQF